MKTEDRRELKSIMDKFQKMMGFFSILFTILTLLSDKNIFNYVFISTLIVYSVYVLTRFINIKLVE